MKVNRLTSTTANIDTFLCFGHTKVLLRSLSRHSDYDDSDASAGSGSRLSYHEEAISDYSGEQFTELWKEYLS
ncbi:hypothetical protein H7X66_13315 [Dysgonomonas sp. BGC7]|nr:hypothetical protein [Dysgonomonas sp. BGC7]